jgi:hypothetical protein
VPVVYPRQNILTTGTVLLQIFALYILIFCIEVNEKKALDAFLFVNSIQANTFNESSFEVDLRALNVKAKVRENISKKINFLNSVLNLQNHSVNNK